MANNYSENLFNRYPFLFPPKEIRDDMTQSCLAFGVETGPGWFPIIDECIAKIAAVDVKHQIKIEQIKEKFGGLRVYYSAYPEEEESIEEGLCEKVDAIIHEAETQAEMTCEVCGVPNTKAISSMGYNNVCAICVMKAEARRNNDR